MDNGELPPEVTGVLGEHHTLTLATSDGSSPWASQVFYAEEVDGEKITIFFASLKPSRKWRHLRSNPIVSFAVGTEAPTRWLQGSGVAEKVGDDREQKRVVGLITQKFPAYEMFISNVPADVFKVTVDEVRVVDVTSGVPKTFWKRTSPRRPAGIGGLVAATRAQVVPVILVPIVIGAVFAWRSQGSFSWLWFAVTCLGGAALHLFANVINDVFDARSGADRVAEVLEDTVRTGSPFATPAMAAVLLSTASVCGAILALYRGWAVLLFGIAGALIAYNYVAPPIMFGYRGRGLGELGIVISFGVLPTAGSYFVQAQQVPWQVWVLGLFPGILTTLVLFHHHFLHWRADRLAGKMSPVASLGPDRALGLSRPALFAAAMVLVTLAGSQKISWLALVAILGFVPVWRSVRPAREHQNLRGYLALLQASVSSSILSGGILVLALLFASP